MALAGERKEWYCVLTFTVIYIEDIEMVNALVALQDHQRHIVFYSKGFYKRTDVMSDLKKIHGRFFVIEEIYIRNADVYGCVHELFTRVRSPEQQNVFWGNIFSRAGSESVAMTELIEQMIGQISICQIYDGARTLIELGLPDYTVLPRSDV